MRRARVFTLLLIVATLLALSPMAYASQIDPSWPRGFYDNGDFDDVIIYLISAVSAVDPAPIGSIDVVPVVLGIVTERADHPALRVVPRSSQPRAPPSA